MSTYVTRYGDLMLMCDGCWKTVEVCKGQTDRLLANDYIHENGWKTMKRRQKWVNICPECKEALESQRREAWLRGEAKRARDDP